MTDEHKAAEQDLLRRAKTFEDSGLLQNEGWKCLCEILEAQIKMRVELLQMPLHRMDPKVVGGATDAESRVLALESIKGALIGLRLALTMPAAMMQDASEIRKEKAKVVQPEEDQTPGVKAP